ncbi:MAG: hypothetical protein QM765_40230 [Myxococcales bacterium]
MDGTLWILGAVSGAAQAGSATKLTSVARFKSLSDCRLRTHAFATAPDGGLVESFSN